MTWLASSALSFCSAPRAGLEAGPTANPPAEPAGTGCPECDTKYRYDEARFGGAEYKQVKCTSCGHSFEVRNPLDEPSNATSIGKMFNAAPEEREKFEINQRRDMLVWDPKNCTINDELRINDYLLPAEPRSPR